MADLTVWEGVVAEGEFIVEVSWTQAWCKVADGDGDFAGDGDADGDGDVAGDGDADGDGDGPVGQLLLHPGAPITQD